MTNNKRIIKAECAYEIEPLKHPFAFKGNALSCIWQTVVRLTTDSDYGVGLGIQSILWSDGAVFEKLGEEEGNRAMFRVTEYATSLLSGAEAEYPIDWLNKNLSRIIDYAKDVTGVANLRTTFVLNALVPLDFAMWQLWYKQKGMTSFDGIYPFDGVRVSELLNVPLITYKTPIDEVPVLAKSGASLLKIKLGSNPDASGDKAQMLEWDKNRLFEIHNAVKDIKTPHTKSGKILYYPDLNGRYESKEDLISLLDFAKEKGIIDRIAILEEPFDEGNEINVSDLPVRIAADESAHSAEDVKKRFELGYKILALKPIAKTLSMTILMAECAKKYDMSCFCADLTVNPTMVTVNQCVAARLAPLPEMKIGIIESNGAQNYSNWDKMTEYHPLYGKGYTGIEDGVFRLSEEFYKRSGGIFESFAHYEEIIEKGVPRG